MKKKSSQAYPPSQNFSASTGFSLSVSKRKEAAPPIPPSEETIQRLNAIVKQTPFCFYYREKENDSIL